MQSVLKTGLLSIIMVLAMAIGSYAGPQAAIRNVTVGNHHELLVNGKPFLPIMSWLQAPKNFAMLRELGFNTFTGNQREVTAKMQCDAAKAAGGYAIAEFGKDGQGAIGHPYLLGWILGDEPDNPRTGSNAVIEPAKHMKVNAETPYTRLVDGVTSSWTVLDPLVGGEFTIDLNKPVTVKKLAIWLTASKSLRVAKEIEFRGDGRLVLKTTLVNRRGSQSFDLRQPATFKALTVKVLSAYPGKSSWGSIGEVEAFDASGKNVLLSKPYAVPKRSPEEIATVYHRIKAADPSRPVFLTFTGMFMKEYRNKYNETMQKKLYPAYAKDCDVAGFDEYPIFGYNFPSHLNWPAAGVDQLQQWVGPNKPIYVWIETHKGSKWVTFKKQLDVLPKHTRYEVWSVLIRGATAIGYFTHAWQPKFTEFAPTAEMQSELKRLNNQITRLAPAILAGRTRRKVTMQMTDGLLCHFKATEYDGALYLFAQNTDLGPNASKLRQGQDISPRGGVATITIAGLKAGTKIKVVDEDRTITTSNGRFTDRFGPLAEHIYRIGK
ncbi:MAG: hypothetical protein GXO98_06715 [Nitrospirae bacterium]|nr:hypothetical protein [Nitrospirota bacterium]